MLPLFGIDPVLAAMTGGPINRPASIFGRVFAEGISISAARAASAIGLADKDVDIAIQDGRLPIRGERKSEEGRTYLYQDRCHGRFEQAIPLPAAVATGGVQAELKDGVLSVTLSKSPEAKSRKIAFKVRSRRAERALAKVAAALVTMTLVLLAAIGTAS